MAPVAKIGIGAGIDTFSAAIDSNWTVMAGGRAIKAIGSVVGMGLEANDGKPGRDKGSQRISVS